MTDEMSGEPSILAKIKAYKLEEIAERKAVRPYEAVAEAAKSASSVRGFADALVAAIASAPEGATATFLLQNLSRRIADQTRDAVQDRGAVAPDDAEAAMAEIVSAIRALEMNGDIRLAGTDAA